MIEYENEKLGSVFNSSFVVVQETDYTPYGLPSPLSLNMPSNDACGNDDGKCFEDLSVASRLEQLSVSKQTSNGSPPSKIMIHCAPFGLMKHSSPGLGQSRK